MDPWSGIISGEHRGSSRICRCCLVSAAQVCSDLTTRDRDEVAHVQNFICDTVCFLGEVRCSRELAC